MRRMVAALALQLATAVPAAALDVQIKDLRGGGNDATVRANVEVRDVVPDRFKHLLDTGSVLHLRLQAELWESRPVWDRLVYPAAMRIFRIARNGRNVTIADASGTTTTHPAVPDPLAVMVDLGDRARLVASGKYYLHLIATVGTIAERDVEETGDAVFGKESETNGLASFGRLLFRTALKVGDYMQSVTTEIKGKRIAGAEILKRQAP